MGSEPGQGPIAQHPGPGSGAGTQGSGPLADGTPR